MDRKTRRDLIESLRNDANRICSRFSLRYASIEPERANVKRRYGICYSDGSIKIRLRHVHTGEPLKYSSLVNTLCHELAHLKHFDHSPRFQAFYLQLLRFARSEAARLSDSVYFRVSGKGANACYVLHTGTRNGCDCAGGQAICRTPGGEIIKAEWLPSSRPLTLQSNAETLEFQHRQGLVTQTGSVELKLAGGSGVRQVIAITGRVRSCYTGPKMSGMTKCA